MKKKARKIAKRFIVMLAAVSMLVMSMPSVSCAAKSKTEQEIQKKEEEKNQVGNKKDKTEKELEELRKREGNLKDKLANLNEQLTLLSIHLMELDEEIRNKEEEIRITQENLARARDLEKWQYECMSARIQMSYVQGKKGILDSFLRATGFGQSLNTPVYQQGVASYDDKKLDEIIDTREFIESEEVRLQGEEEELQQLRAEAEAEKNKVSNLIVETGESIEEYGDLIDDAEAKALAYEKEMQKLDGDLEKLKKKLKEEQEASRRAAAGVWRNIGDVSFSDSDRVLLANLIYCEAGAEPYEGKVAVGAVVVNRVLSGCYPDTMVGVIYQKSQFSPVASGRLELALASNKATKSCYDAADEAMAGKTNVGNCVYFRTPIEGLTGISIGGHIFY